MLHGESVRTFRLTLSGSEVFTLILLESSGDSKASKITELILDKLSSGETKFEERIGDTLIWCNADLDTTIFIQVDNDGGYSAINKDDVNELSEKDIEESIAYQLEHTKG